MQEQLQNSFNSLLNNDNTINNQVQYLKKELSNVKEIINMDMEGAYNIIRKIAGWGCLMNSGVRIISDKMGFITQALEKVETYAIDHENIQQRLNSHEDVINKVHNNMRISIEGYASEQQQINAELSKNMEDKADGKIQISEFKIQEILSNSTNSIKKELLELKNTIISKEELQKAEINKSIHTSNDQLNQIIRGNEEKLSLIFSKINAIDIEQKASHMNLVNTQNICDIKIMEIDGKLTNNLITIQEVDSKFKSIINTQQSSGEYFQQLSSNLTQQKNKIDELEIKIQKSMLTQNDKLREFEHQNKEILANKFEEFKENIKEINLNMKDLKNNNELIKRSTEKCLKESQETLTTSINKSQEDINKIVDTNEKELTNTIRTVTEEQNSKIMNLQQENNKIKNKIDEMQSNYKLKIQELENNYKNNISNIIADSECSKDENKKSFQIAINQNQKNANKVIELENEISIIKNLLNKQSIEENNRLKHIELIEYEQNNIKSTNSKIEKKRHSPKNFSFIFLF